MPTFDVAIVGLGAVGGAALLAGARARGRVVGFDRYSPPHVLGSTHGETRIVRAAIGEGADYTPFALRSFELTDRLAAETASTLRTRCGLLVLGSTLPHASHVPAGFLDTTIEAARRYSIPHEVLDARAVRERFPAYASYDGAPAYYEPGAGMAYPERVVDAQIRRARELGAEAHVDTRVLAIASYGRTVTIETAKGRVEAGRAILAAGAWNPTFLPPAVAERLTVTRQTLHWFEAPSVSRAFEAERMPVFIWNELYGFPIASEDGGVKIATETLSAVVDPEGDVRPAGQADIDDIEPRARAAFPQLGRHLRGATCLYTSTPDFNFWAGPHPLHANVTVVSACSGHGFKHAAALGEAVAMEALGRRATAIPEAWRHVKGSAPVPSTER
jgi:sarcosine oxidase